MQCQLFVCLVMALISLAVSEQKKVRISENERIQQYFVDLEKSGYNKNVMPEGNGRFGYPVQVRCEMYLIDISKVDDLSMDYRAMFYFRQYWNDSRLTFPNPPINSISFYDPSLIWTPDLFFVQEKEGIHHNLITPNTFIKISTNGEVRYSVRLSMTFRCPMDFTKYPHDVQKCNFQIESYGSKREQMELSWQQGIPVSFNKNISTVNFALKEVKESVNNLVLNVGDYTRLQVSLVFQRKTGYFMIQLYAPFLLLIGISWLCFWIPPKMLVLRLPLLLVVLYLMVHVGSEINSRSPPVSYTKGSDVWIAVCESLVFTSFLETIAVYIIFKKKENLSKESAEGESTLEIDEKMNRVNADSSVNLVASRLKCGDLLHKKIDKISAFLFPTVFIIFCSVYGIIYCCRRQ